ncbi:MAG: outer membrane protein [Polaribacter sp.]|jgi:outer membrane protein
MSKYTYTKLTAALLLTLCSQSILASGITRDIRESANTEDAREDGGYFELGVGVYVTNTIIFKGNEDDKKYAVGPQINLGYQWKGLFIDINDDDGFVFGYNALNTDHWSYDIVGGSIFGIDSDVSDDFVSLRKRESVGTIGIRATGFYNKDIFQFEVKRASNDDFDGLQASVLAGTSWQYRNLNTHMVVGLHYSAEDINDYYWGVNSVEANDDFEQYKAGASTTFSTELGITYPISESWVFRSKLNYVYGSEEFANSPLRANNSQHFLSARATVSYVF